jgi:Ca-activated chloride channel family protein
MATPRPPAVPLAFAMAGRRWPIPLAAALLATCCALPALAQKTNPPREEALRVEARTLPRFVAPQAQTPIELRSYRQDVTVVAQTVQTRVTLDIFNANPRVLEGELQFPLQDGQIVSGFSLDIDGSLRRAVPVAKAKGLQVFEDTIRGRVDPALLEATAGNQYKLRVYPLPPNGSRTVVLNLTQALGSESGSKERRLLLPLGLDGAVSRAEMSLRVAGVAPAAVRASLHGLPPEALLLQASGSDTLIQVAANALSRPAQLALRFSPPEQATQMAARFDGQDFIYAEIPAPGGSVPRPAPKRLALVWDASGSAAQRDIPQELALLDALFARWQNLDVNLYVLRDRLEAPQRFEVRGGRWQALRKQIQAEPFDGATQLGAVQLTRQMGDLGLLFTDGQSTFGPRRGPGFDIPTFAVQTAPGSDAGTLRQFVESKGGAVLDLQRLKTLQAVQRINTVQPWLVELRSAQGQQWVAASRLAEQGRIALAGVANQPAGTLEAVFQLPDLSMKTQLLRWAPPVAAMLRPTVAARPSASPAISMPDDDAPALPALRWATLTLDTLRFQPEAHRAEVQRLGQRFGLATSETSLIVLDNLADYVRHRIEPPAGPLRAAYLAQAGAIDVTQQRSQQAHLDQLVQRFKDKQAWWATEFPKDPAPAPRDAQPANSGAIGSSGNAVPGGPLADMQRQRAQSSDKRADSVAAPPPPAPAMAAAPVAPAARAERLAEAAVASPRQMLAKSKADGESDSKQTEAATSIQLRAWTPDAAHARRLRAAKPQDRYAVYLDERPGQLKSTAFFLDAADLFFAQGDNALGVRVLSNLAEMALENRSLLRLLGYRLLQAERAELAVPVFERVREIAPHEPQSSRDLGLALIDAKQWQAAADALWHTAATPWAGGRFPDIDLTALAELNALVARARRSGQPVNTSAMDPRLLVNLPLGLRVVMGWDADNTDIDLHVRDPNGEEAFYGHQRTRQGGRMSADFTGGYGPEEFSLRKPKPGTYSVRARFYGHRQQVLAPATTLMLRLVTNFGTAAEKEQRVMLRLSSAGDMVAVGEFQVDAASD